MFIPIDKPGGGLRDVDYYSTSHRVYVTLPAPHDDKWDTPYDLIEQVEQVIEREDGTWA
jgi:hypothetical protein